MKVSELKIGMLIECTNSEDQFLISTYSNETWLRVVNRKFGFRNQKTRPPSPPIGIYLGTKADIDIKVTWSNRFLLVGNQITAVDPSSWKFLKVFSEVEK